MSPRGRRGQEVARLPERPATAEDFWCLVWDQMPETLDFEQPIDEAQRCALRIGALCVAWLLLR
jgi:hypothetical protein